MGLENILSIVVNNFVQLLPVRKVNSYQQAVKFRKGRDIRLLKTGIYFFIPYYEGIEVRDTQKEVVNLPNQTLITKDKQCICISGAVEYKIEDLRKWWMAVQDFDNTLINIALGYLGREVRKHDFSEIHDTTKLEEEVYKSLKEKIDGWGVELYDFYITDFAPSKSIRLFGDNGGNVIKKNILQSLT